MPSFRDLEKCLPAVNLRGLEYVWEVPWMRVNATAVLVVNELRLLFVPFDRV